MKFYLKSIGLLLLSAIVACTSPSEQKTEIQTSEYPEWTKDKNLYEVNIRQYTPEGTFNAFAAELPRLKDMGVDILWLMPIHPVGEKNAKGSLGSYYAVKDYKAVNPNYGTEEDFRNLVKKAHDLGMYIIIDWVANHTAWDNPLTISNPEWYTKDSLGNFTPPVGTDWSDVIDLNYENEELNTYMIDALSYWVEEFDIDGYRCDVADWVPAEFWKRAIDTLRSKKEVFMLAEAENPEMHEVGFNMTYSWELFHHINAIAGGKENAHHLDSMITKNATRFSMENYRMNFITNHDENSWNGTADSLLGDAHETMLALTYTLPGMPLTYSGQESNNQKKLEFFEKDAIQWGDYEMANFYRQLNQLKHEQPALWNGDFGGSFEKIKTSNDTDIFAFNRIKGDDVVTVIFNLSSNDQEVTMKTPISGTDYFSQEKISIAVDEKLSLAPWAYHILIK
ncbi:alpha-amylase family glycosyl hydrolase [Penaeicola halotolerans]|uniref:alpha-amylase family glycosyl hydrolase n=1 Tax=Penaeicola halotolerans TaxID=2793196 RepID=UPI001CF7EE51|nr:alpha-amylase family glycosyl hydrolase [Penaeicola halotolerans]